MTKSSILKKLPLQALTLQINGVFCGKLSGTVKNKKPLRFAKFFKFLCEATLTTKHKLSKNQMKIS